MNYSLFISQLQMETGQMWLETMESKDEYSRQRAFDDNLERKFWEEHSKKYDDRPSLYDYCPEALDKITSIIGEGKEVLEFGVGTGKFTLPMAKRQKSILAVDFSSDMLEELAGKIRGENNIELINGKIENLDSLKVDAIYGVNSIYRIQDMKEAINNMMEMASEKVLFVWTMQRSIYDSIINSGSKKGILRKQEYIHLISLLYDMGIDPSLEIMKVNKNIEIEDIQDNYRELLTISEDYDLDYDYLKKEFKKRCFEDGALYYKCELKVAYIYFETR